MIRQMTTMMCRHPGNVILSTRTWILHRNTDAWPVDTDGMKAPRNLPTVPPSRLSNATLRIQLKLKYVTLSPRQGGTPLSPKFATFLEDEISHHETSSVSSSAVNCASSLNSDCSTQGKNGLPADSIHLWHVDAFNEQLQCHMLKSARTWRPSPTLPDDDDYPSTNIVDHRRRTLSGLPRPCGWDEDSTDSSDASELCLSEDNAVFDDVRTAHDTTHQHQVCASMQRAAASRPQIDETGPVVVRRWSGPRDALSHHATSSVSSSAMNHASSSSSDTGMHGTDELPVTAIRFWTSKASRELPTIAHADSWTPAALSHSRIRHLIGSDENTADQCNWDQPSTELRHLNSQTLTGRCTNPDTASHTFTSHNIALRPDRRFTMCDAHRHPWTSHVARPRNSSFR